MEKSFLPRSDPTRSDLLPAGMRQRETVEKKGGGQLNFFRTLTGYAVMQAVQSISTPAGPFLKLGSRHKGGSEGIPHLSGKASSKSCGNQTTERSKARASGLQG